MYLCVIFFYDKINVTLVGFCVLQAGPIKWKLPCCQRSVLSIRPHPSTVFHLKACQNVISITISLYLKIKKIFFLEIIEISNLFTKRIILCRIYMCTICMLLYVCVCGCARVCVYHQFLFSVPLFLFFLFFFY